MGASCRRRGGCRPSPGTVVDSPSGMGVMEGIAVPGESRSSGCRPRADYCPDRRSSCCDRDQRHRPQAPASPQPDRNCRPVATARPRLSSRRGGERRRRSIAARAGSSQALRELARSQVSGEELGERVTLPVRQFWGQLPCHLHGLPGAPRAYAMIRCDGDAGAADDVRELRARHPPVGERGSRPLRNAAARTGQLSGRCWLPTWPSQAQTVR